MSQASKIEWTDATWNPIRGCARVAARFSGPGQTYEGLAVMRNGEPHWTGKVRLVEEALDWPLRRRKPLRIFVNSMSDLFHEGLTREQIVPVIEIMCRAQQHTFQVLTKRPLRMLGLLSDLSAFWGALGPPPNIWWGVSVEDQATADERIPLLLQTPAAVRWISAEPLLGPINLLDTAGDPLGDDGGDFGQKLDWVVVGGESGPSARPMFIQWAESIVEQCREAGVPVFVKQLGSGNRSWHDGHREHHISGKGGKLEEMPEFLRVRQFPEGRP